MQKALKLKIADIFSENFARVTADSNTEAGALMDTLDDCEKQIRKTRDIVETFEQSLGS